MTNQCLRCGAPTDFYVCRPEARDLADQLLVAAGHAEDAWTVIARQTRIGHGGGGRGEPPELGAIPGDNVRNPVTTFGWQASIERPPIGALRPEPTPADLGALDRYHAAEATITTWAGTHDGGLPAACRYLATQIDDLRQHPAAKDAFDDLEAACRQLERLVDRRVDNRHFIGICNCNRALYAPWNWTIIQCKDKTCGAVWNLADGQDILLRHLDDKLVTAGEAAKLAGHLDPDRSQDAVRKLIEKWAARGRLTPHGHIMREPTDAEIRRDPEAYPVPVPTYRFGEIRQLLDETPRRNRQGAAA